MFQETDIAFVTGAGSGIGRATCELLAEQGATVVAAGITKEKVEDTVLGLAGKNHMSIQLDVAKRDSVVDAIAKVIARYSSPPNITVNCAGQSFLHSLLDCTEEMYDRLFDNNTKGAVCVTQSVCQALVEAKKKGSIINITSIVTSGAANLSVYSASKKAVESFSFSAAKEFGPYGIRVNVVSPGFIETPMSAAYNEIRNIMVEKNPLKRTGLPNELAEVISFLASDKSSYVNATSMAVDGGGSL